MNIDTSTTGKKILLEGEDNERRLSARARGFIKGNGSQKFAHCRGAKKEEKSDLNEDQLARAH